jgi:hypothetical protein
MPWKEVGNPYREVHLEKHGLFSIVLKEKLEQALR